MGREKRADVEQAKVLFGKHIASVRRELGLSQIELAIRCGFAHTYIGAIERAEYEVKLGTILRLAKGLGVKPADLLTF